MGEDDFDVSAMGRLAGNATPTQFQYGAGMLLGHVSNGLHAVKKEQAKQGTTINAISSSVNATNETVLQLQQQISEQGEMIKQLFVRATGTASAAPALTAPASMPLSDT
jgi:hypothetical protein